MSEYNAGTTEALEHKMAGKQAPFIHSADTDRKTLLAVLTPDLPVTTQ